MKSFIKNTVSKKYCLRFFIFLSIFMCLNINISGALDTSQYDALAYNAAKHAVRGAFDELDSKKSSFNFLPYADKFFNGLMSSFGKSLKSNEFKQVTKNLNNAVSEGLTEATKGLSTGMSNSTGIFNSALDENSKELSKGIDQAINNVGKQMQTTFKNNGELDKGLAQAVYLYTRNFNRGITEIVHKNLIKGGLIFVSTATTYYLAAHGIPLCIRMIERAWLKPKLIIASSKKTWKEFFFGRNKKDEKPMVFSPELEERLNGIINVTSTIQSKIKEGKTNVKYRNLMLYGPPGTGKTLFATELAKRSGMEYAYMSGSSFSKFKDGEGIEALDELFAWANKSKGLLIFIDEAETFLSKRENMDPQSKSAQLLNNFLNYTGTRSDKFMIVFATNHKEVLDSAMYRRIDDLIEIPLPNKAERINILNLYKERILLDTAQNDPVFIESVNTVLTSQKIEEIALATKGLSGGELEGIFNSLKTDADILTPSVITSKLVDKVVKQAIEKQKAFTQGRLLGTVAN